MTNEEMRSRLKALSAGSIYRDGYFPLNEIRKRIGEQTNTRLSRFINNTEGDRPSSRRIYPAQKKRLAELLLKIECGMLQCKITQEYRTPELPWRKSNIKTLKEFDTPQTHVKAMHTINMGPGGVSLNMGSPSEKKVMPSFMGAFGEGFPILKTGEK